MWNTVLQLFATLVVIWCAHWVYRWRNPKCNGKLPPGSMGLPFLGETIPFFTPYTGNDVHPFVKKRIERYGAIFKTSVVGQPFIVSTDGDLNHFIFQQEGRLFESWLPKTFTEGFGRQNIGSMQGYMYKHLKSMILSLFGVERLKKTLLPEINRYAATALAQWVAMPSLELKEATAAMIFSLTAKKLISCEDANSLETMRKNCEAFIQGIVLSFPFDIPGTNHHKCMQGCRNAMKALKEMLDKRLSLSPGERKGDFLDMIIDQVNSESGFLNEAIALNVIFAILFASFETTSLALTLAVKYLTDNPHVLKKLTEEQEEILKTKEDPNAGITWAEYKSMTFTSQVINEAVRLANIAPGIFRKTLEDIKIKGYTIPAGWAIMVCPPALHLDPSKYEDPLAFNPHRWQGIDTSAGSKNFLAFGGGARFCVGADFSKLQMIIFLHHLVTKYRWEAVKGGDIVRSPGLSFPNGYHIRLLAKQK